MSFQADVEHIYTPVNALPKTLRGIFPDGACCVFTNEELTAAFPATEEQTNELADLLEVFAFAPADDDPAMKAYFEMRDELCGDKPYGWYSVMFKTEMEKEFNRDTKLASAARNN